jgi:hypothetical protein
MAYPTLIPSARNYSSGDYPVKTFTSQSGAESRILYGSRRTGMTLELQYDNVTDANAELFLDHYDETKGSYTTFTLPTAAFTGWSGNKDAIDAATGNAWRYDGPPQVSNVRPGVSSVQIKLIGVL